MYKQIECCMEPLLENFSSILIHNKFIWFLKDESGFLKMNRDVKRFVQRSFTNI